MNTRDHDSATTGEERLRVLGMTCANCARHVETALRSVPGVRSASVSLAESLATIRLAAGTEVAALREAVAAAGYSLGEPPLPGRADRPRRWIVAGPLATLGLLAFYLGTITLAQGWPHAIQQLAEDRWFVGALSLGFGIQVGLFAYLHERHSGTRSRGIAASAGTSGTAMLACCVHHLTDILPFLGVSGAAAFLGAYKAPLLWLGIGSNVAGIAYLIWQIRRLRRSTFGREPEAR